MSYCKPGLTLILSAAFVGAFGVASAEPQRVQSLGYDAQTVWRLTVAPDRALQIIPPEDETLGQVVIGSGVGWEIEVDAGVIFVRAAAEAAATNLLWITDGPHGRRSYRADLVIGRPSAGLYEVRFKSDPSPMAEAEEAQALSEKLEIERRLAQAPFLGARNLQYEAVGDLQLKPLEVFDNGRFTVLHFADTQSFPSLYRVAGDGTEQLLRYDVRGAQMIIPGVHAELRLRKGQSHLRLINQAFAPASTVDRAPTPRPDVLRDLRDGGGP